MRIVDTIINALDDKVKQKTRAQTMKTYLKKIFENEQLYRRMKYISLIHANVELAYEYFGYDYLSQPDLHYDNKIEKLINETELKMSEFIGRVIYELDNTGMQIEI